MIELKINTKNQLLPFKWLLSIAVMFIGGIIYYNHFISTIVFVISFVIFLSLQLLFHIKYYLENNKFSYTISKDNINILSYKNEKKINKIDIESIKLVKPANLDDGWNIHFLGITYYYYLLIKTKNGESFILTNLLHPNIDKVLEEYGYSFYREKGFGWF